MTRLARPYDSSRTPLILENSIHLSYPLPRARAAFVAASARLFVLPRAARTPGAPQDAYRIG